MGHLLLTGASGLLGAYLVRDLLERGVKLAVLVRASRMASARERMETIMAHWEAKCGHALPRPVVLEGDLSSPTLGLSDEDRAWAARHCHALMHNAASLTFHAKDDVGEPWRSNREGVRNVLSFCEQQGILEFHHVSTAYICGKRRELINESETDVGQEPGNDYEQSKLEAEIMVRNSDFINSLTVYRPGIILGDSRDGYTTTYHGFYVPLKLISELMSKAVNSEMSGISPEMLKSVIKMGGDRLREALNAKGDECKNFVPVDWVSEAMARIYCDRQNHGETYHLTPIKPTRVELFQKMIENIFFEYAEQSGQSNPASSKDMDNFEGYFVNQMKTYQSYWGNDPIFDSTNTQRVCADLPCPVIDEEMFKVMSTYAIEDNFGWPVKPPVKPEFDIDAYMKGLFSSNLPADGTTLTLSVTGIGGGCWTFGLENGMAIAMEQGDVSDSEERVNMNSQTFLQLMNQQLTIKSALDSGRVMVEGDCGKGLEALLQQILRPQQESIIVETTV